MDRIGRLTGCQARKLDHGRLGEIRIRKEANDVVAKYTLGSHLPEYRMYWVSANPVLAK